MTGGFLAQILPRKVAEIEALRPRAEELRAKAADAPRPRPWRERLRQPGRVALIAELKRRAPSAGPLNPRLDPAALAETYELAGAAALSVLTDSDFDGDLADLQAARVAVDIPVLRKDFILDTLQVLEARAAGGDAVLLIVRLLSEALLAELLDAAAQAGLGTLVEVHDERELDRALASGAPVIGVNNRDLTTFAVNLETTRRLAGQVPGDRVLVGESGIETPDQVREMGALGVDAVLVGRALVSHPRPGELASGLTTQPRRDRG